MDGLLDVTVASNMPRASMMRHRRQKRCISTCISKKTKPHKPARIAMRSKYFAAERAGKQAYTKEHGKGNDPEDRKGNTSNASEVRVYDHLAAYRTATEGGKRERRWSIRLATHPTRARIASTRKAIILKDLHPHSTKRTTGLQLANARKSANIESG